MSTTAQQADWSRAQTALLGLPARRDDWLDSLRRAARDSLSAQAALDRTSETWRYSRAGQVLRDTYTAPAGDARLDAGRFAALGLPRIDDAWQLVFHNGHLQPHLSRIDGLPEGVVLDSLPLALGRDAQQLSPCLGSIAPTHDNLFTALNTGWVEQGLYLRLGPGVRLERPLQLLQVSQGAQQPMLSQPRHLVVLDEDASATLIEHYVGRDNYFLNHLSEISLAAGARLHHYRVQHESTQARHLSSLYLRQQEASRYQGGTVSLGGAWARCDYSVAFAGPGADCDLQGLCLVGDGVLGDFHLDIRHQVPGCRSKAHFKGIAWGKARGVFDGRVLVAAQAQRSDAMLKNDNLILGREAEIDTKPQLEIYADDVKAGHGTTVGQLEPEQLFYLRSRGIAPIEARRLLCEGFAAEILEDFGPDPVREHACRRLATWLAQVPREV